MGVDSASFELIPGGHWDPMIRDLEREGDY